jgi:hypothetical protein
MTVGTYFLIALILILLVLFGIRFYRTYKEKGEKAAVAEMREVAYSLFLKAEKLFGRDMGKSKMQWVIGQFYRLIAPGWLAKLLPETTIQDFLQGIYDDYYYRLKDYLDDGQVNGSPPKDETFDPADPAIPVFNEEIEPVPTPAVYPSPPGA